MKIFAIVLAAGALLFGLRLLSIAIRIITTGQILVRHGPRSTWQPAPTPQDIWKVAVGEALMGLLFIILAVFLLT